MHPDILAKLSRSSGRQPAQTLPVTLNPAGARSEALLAKYGAQTAAGGMCARARRGTRARAGQLVVWGALLWRSRGIPAVLCQPSEGERAILRNSENEWPNFRPFLSSKIGQDLYGVRLD